VQPRAAIKRPARAVAIGSRAGCDQRPFDAAKPDLRAGILPPFAVAEQIADGRAGGRGVERHADPFRRERHGRLQPRGRQDQPRPLPCRNDPHRQIRLAALGADQPGVLPGHGREDRGEDRPTDPADGAAHRRQQQQCDDARQVITRELDVERAQQQGRDGPPQADGQPQHRIGAGGAGRDEQEQEQRDREPRRA
jgi:hypothetical protein